MFYLPDAEVQQCCKDRREAIFAQEAVVHGLDHDLDAKEEARKLYHTTLIALLLKIHICPKPESACFRLATVGYARYMCEYILEGIF